MMRDDWIGELAERVAAASCGAGLPHRATLLSVARHVMLCQVYGGLHSRTQIPAVTDGPPGARTPVLFQHLFGPTSLLGEAVCMGSVGGSADLDPMDPAPAHAALPATVAALVLARHLSATENELVAAIGSGLEAGACCCGLVSERTPGRGLHSAGTFGTLAAAAASARLLKLTPGQVRIALGIAATRAAGLAVNSRWAVGMTHFGWAAAHGLESAWLAGNGWRGHPDVERSILSLLGCEGPNASPALAGTGSLVERRGLFYKLYPCNVYLNLVAAALSRLDLAPGAARSVTVELPPVYHLDHAGAREPRERRNSLQAVVGGILQSHHPGQLLVGPPDPADCCAIAAWFNPDISVDLRRTHVTLTVTLASGQTTQVTQDAGVLDAPDEVWASQLVAGSPRAETIVHGIWSMPLAQAWGGVVNFLQEEAATCA